MLKNQFGIDKLEFKIRIGGKNKIYAFKECEVNLNTYFFGLYFGRKEKDGVRLSVEGSYLIAKKAKKGVVLLNDKEALRWMKGKDIEKEGIFGYVILKWGDYILGCGKGNGKKIKNFLPSLRRLRP